MKKSIIAAILSTSTAVYAVEAGPTFIISLPIKAPLSSWSTVTPTVHPWVNVGFHYDCTPWNPDASTKGFGITFPQDRDCQQDQKRNIDIRELDSFSKVIKIINTVQEFQTLTEEEDQNATGTLRDWQSYASVFTDWEDFGVDYDHDTWAPIAANQAADFTQSRDFQHKQERFEQKQEQDTYSNDIQDTGAPIRHEQALTRNEDRLVDVEVGAWFDVGGNVGCEAWSPLPETIDVNQNFTQIRDCDQAQTRNWTYDASGSQIHSRLENQTITETESQPEVGTKRDWALTTSTFTAWIDNGAHHSPGAWTPVSSAQVSNFTQTRAVKQPQEQFEQKRELDAISGDVREVGDPISHLQDIDETESRSVDVSRSTWSNTTTDNYTIWSPVASSQTIDFNQSRTFSQDQVRTRTYKTGSTTLHTANETQVLTNQSESRLVTVSWSDWEVDLGNSVCDVWLPKTNTQGYNVAFTQTRDCTQAQNRIRSYSIGGSFTESSNISIAESQEVTGTGNWIAIPTQYGQWEIDHSKTGYGASSPAFSAQTDDFVVTRSVIYRYERSGPMRELDTISGYIRETGSTQKQFKRVSGADEVKEVIVELQYSLRQGNLYDCNGWLPEPVAADAGHWVRQYNECKALFKKVFKFRYKNGDTLYYSHNVYEEGIYFDGRNKLF